jgi:hypothetical protein
MFDILTNHQQMQQIIYLLDQVVLIFTAGWFNAGEQVHDFVRAVAKRMGGTIRIRMIDVEEIEVLML